MATEAEFIEEGTAQRFATVVRSIAEGLREMADQVERRATPHASLRTLTPDFHGAAGDVLHDITSGLANLGLQRLPHCARDAHEAATTRAGGVSGGGGEA